MTIFEAIQTFLLANSGVTDIVGTKIYQGERTPQESRPAISFEELQEGEDYYDLNAGSVGLATKYFRFNCYSSTSKQAQQIRDIVREMFASQHGNVDGKMGGASGVYVFGCLFVEEGGDYDPPTGQFVRFVDFEIQYAKEVA